MTNSCGYCGWILVAIAIVACTEPEAPDRLVTESGPPQFSEEPGDCGGGWAESGFVNDCQTITAQASPDLVLDSYHANGNGWRTPIDGMRFCNAAGTDWPDHVPSQAVDISFSSPVSSVWLSLYASTSGPSIAQRANT